MSSSSGDTQSALADVSAAVTAATTAAVTATAAAAGVAAIAVYPTDCVTQVEAEAVCCHTLSGQATLLPALPTLPPGLHLR